MWVGLPDGFVGDDDLGPLILGEALGNGIQLPGNNVEGLVGFTFLFSPKKSP